MSDHDPSANSPVTDDQWNALARVVAGEGSPEDRAMADSLAARDPALARLVGVLDEVSVPAAAAPPSAREVEAALAAVLARRDDVTSSPGVVSLAEYRSRWRSARFRAAAAVLVVAGASLVWRELAKSDTSAVASAPKQQYAAAVGALDSVRLSDGTRVLLGPGSSITVAAGYGGSARDVSLVGDARFSVAHDASRPFVVHAGAASFRDVGTVFAVSVSRAGIARVAVSEGAVAMSGAASSDSVVLRAGDRGAVGAGGSVSVERAGATQDDVAWTAGRLVLRDATVHETVADLQRWYGMEVRVDSALAGHTVNATFERGAAPADVARVVAALLGGGVREEGGTYRIVAPPGVAPVK